MTRSYDIVIWFGLEMRILLKLYIILYEKNFFF